MLTIVIQSGDFLRLLKGSQCYVLTSEGFLIRSILSIYQATNLELYVKL